MAWEICKASLFSHKLTGICQAMLRCSYLKRAASYRVMLGFIYYRTRGGNLPLSQTARAYSVPVGSRGFAHPTMPSGCPSLLTSTSSLPYLRYLKMWLLLSTSHLQRGAGHHVNRFIQLIRNLYQLHAIRAIIQDSGVNIRTAIPTYNCSMEIFEFIQQAFYTTKARGVSTVGLWVR
jgi:hypothetical protein